MQKILVTLFVITVGALNAAEIQPLPGMEPKFEKVPKGNRIRPYYCAGSTTFIAQHIGIGLRSRDFEKATATDTSLHIYASPLMLSLGLKRFLAISPKYSYLWYGTNEISYKGIVVEGYVPMRLSEFNSIAFVIPNIGVSWGQELPNKGFTQLQVNILPAGYAAVAAGHFLLSPTKGIELGGGLLGLLISTPYIIDYTVGF